MRIDAEQPYVLMRTMNGKLCQALNNNATFSASLVDLVLQVIMP
jgi:hypothetical protein